MYASHLGKDIITDNGLIGRHGYTTITLYQTGDIIELILIDIGLGMELILENHLHAGQWGITTALAQTVDCNMDTLDATEHSCQRITHRQIVIVMGVEIEMGIRIALHHLAEVLDTLQGIHDAQGIGQHKPADADIAEPIHHIVDIRGRILHTIRPVFQIEIDCQAFPASVLHLMDDILEMLLRCLVKLFLAMAQRALGQKVDSLTTTGFHPVYTLAAINESQHLYPIQHVYLAGITAYHTDSLFLTIGDACRGSLYAIYIQIAKQHAGDDQLLVGQETDATGLLAIAQCGVQDLHKRLELFVMSYLFCCSHNSVFSLFCTRKSISSRPFIRQCFL